jgi:Flp pilus assembly protein TadG
MPGRRNFNHSSPQRRGTTLLYATFGVVAMIGFGSLAVDVGRVVVAKAQLQDNADAIARYAAMGLSNKLNDESAAKDNAAAASNTLKVDGTALQFNSQNQVELGIWNASNKTFTPSNDLDKTNAVRVRATHIVGAGSPLTLASLIGRSTVEIESTAVALATRTGYLGDGGGSYDYYVSANSNPWLAGTPEGTVANPTAPGREDYSGKPKKDDGKKKSLKYEDIVKDKTDPKTKQSPLEAGTINLKPGEALTFDGLNGGANNFSSKKVFEADGNFDWIINNWEGAEHGKSDIRAPINSLIAVFLDDSNPMGKSAPSRLDFSSEASRDFSVLKPQLRQMFFVGDGRRDNGEPQQFVIPPGATRLYIGTMDGWEWNNNQGGFAVTVHTRPIISVVR